MWKTMCVPIKLKILLDFKSRINEWILSEEHNTKLVISLHLKYVLRNSAWSADRLLLTDCYIEEDTPCHFLFLKIVHLFSLFYKSLWKCAHCDLCFTCFLLRRLPFWSSIAIIVDVIKWVLWTSEINRILSQILHQLSVFIIQSLYLRSKRISVPRQISNHLN